MSKHDDPQKDLAEIEKEIFNKTKLSGNIINNDENEFKVDIDIDEIKLFKPIQISKDNSEIKLKRKRLNVSRGALVVSILTLFVLSFTLYIIKKEYNNSRNHLYNIQEQTRMQKEDQDIDRILKASHFSLIIKDTEKKAGNDVIHSISISNNNIFQRQETKLSGEDISDKNIYFDLKQIFLPNFTFINNYDIKLILIFNDFIHVEFKIDELDEFDSSERNKKIIEKLKNDNNKSNLIGEIYVIANIIIEKKQVKTNQEL